MNTKRIMVIGSPGSGKSTFARKLRDKSGLPLFYLDMIYHRPDKTTCTPQEFDEKLDEILNLVVDDKLENEKKAILNYLNR